MISSPIVFIELQGMTNSSFEENKLKNFVLPGTIISFIVPVSKSAVTSWTKPSRFPSIILITSLCLKSKPFLYDIKNLPKIYIKNI